MVRRFVPLSPVRERTVPTSSINPVNIWACPKLILTPGRRERREKNVLKTPRPRHLGGETFPLPSGGLIRVPKIALHSKILSEPVQAYVLYIRRFAYAPEALAAAKGNRACTGQNPGRVVEEYFIDHACDER